MTWTWRGHCEQCRPLIPHPSYKRTEFEEGDGDSVGGSSLDSVGAVALDVNSNADAGKYEPRFGGTETCSISVRGSVRPSVRVTVLVKTVGIREL